MSAILQDRAILRGPVSGGTAGRRVVIRWARRLLRREWRQQILVLALLVLTVGAASFGVAAAYNLAPLPSPQLGSADYLLQFAGPGNAMTADIAAARKAFGTIEVIGHQFVPIPGSAQSVEFRALSPGGPYSGPVLALVQGHYPSGAGQAPPYPCPDTTKG
jgi:putative ABC transport system permease protein